MFNSQKRNNDPKPYYVVETVRDGFDGRYSKDEIDAASVLHPPADTLYHLAEFCPRPEFDNNPNRILVEAREHLSRATRPDRALATWLNWIDDPTSDRDSPEPWIDEERVHARKVLQRLASDPAD